MDYLQDGIQDLDSSVKKKILFDKIQEIIHYINGQENIRKKASRLIDKIKADDEIK